MVKKIITFYKLTPLLKVLLRFRKNLFLLVLFYFFAFSFNAFGVKDNEELTEEKIRQDLQQEYNNAKNKSTFAKDTAGVASVTLKKFLAGEEVSKSTLKKIRDKLKEKPSAPTSSISTQSSALVMASTLPSEKPPDKTSLCLNLSALPFYSSFPETYSLFMLDSSLVPPTVAWNQQPQFADIGQLFLRSTLVKDKDLSFAETEEKAQEKERWLLKYEKPMPGVNKDKKTCYIVQLFKKRKKQRAANLVQALTEHKTSASDGFDFEAGLIIFPFSPKIAMVYGLGRWDSLLNPDCILPQWGLRLATSGQVCNPNKVKELSEVCYRTSNPVSRRDKVAVLQAIEGFGLEVGSEELKAISLMPNNSIKTSHVIEGKDYLQFTVNPSDNATLEQTLHSLHSIAEHFFTLTTDSNFCVHSRMREFIDDEVRDVELLKTLNERLQSILRTSEGKEFAFLHDDLWREMKNKKLLFGEEKKYSVFEVFAQLPPETPIFGTIQVWKPKLSHAREFDVQRIFYTLPFEYEGKFYRFDRTHWYQVDPSRFEGVKRMLRKVKIKSSDLQLPDYSIEDTERVKEEKKADYKEAKYNLRAAQEVQKKPGWNAILLDRINVSLGEAHSKFEFADILLMHNNIFYIVHVKRAEASQLSHLREQVERSVDFLTTELVKKSAHTIFLQGIVHSLYKRNGLPVTKDKEKKQGTRITKGQLFLDFYNSGKNNFFVNLEQQYKETADKTLQGFIQKALNVIDRDFFDKYPFELATILDALYDCNSAEKNISDEEIKEFLEAVKQATQARDFLFPKGPLKKSDLSRIKVVLVLIDDRKIDADTKGKKTRLEPLFKRQDLWGLDRTRTIVEKTGLGFILTIPNENTTESQDAFGAIVKREKIDNFICSDGEKPELPFSPLSFHSSSSSSSASPVKQEIGQNDGFSETSDFSSSVSSSSSSSSSSAQRALNDEDTLKYDPNISILTRENSDNLPIRSRFLNPISDEVEQQTYQIDGKYFRLQNVSGKLMRCFFNAAGLEADMEIAKLNSKENDAIVRLMIANEIVSATLTPEQLPKSVKEAILYPLYKDKEETHIVIENVRSNILRKQNPDGNYQNTQNLPEIFQQLGGMREQNLDDLRKKASSLEAFRAFLKDYIGSKNMMVALHDVKGELGDNVNANYTSIDAIAYVNKLGIKIYQPEGSEGLRLVHSYIPRDATEVVYLYHAGVHFQALVPN